MIRRFVIQQFKGFTSLELNFATLTVLTGRNNSGKSSVIQALLLAQVACESGDSISINGPYGLALGESQDILNVDASDQAISLRIEADDFIDDFRLTVPDGRALVLTNDSPTLPRRTAGYIDDYLGAERLGPRHYLDVTTLQPEHPSVGVRGEYTAYVLALLDTTRATVTDVRQHAGNGDVSLAATLRAQAEAWLSSIAGDVQIDPVWPKDVSVATLRFKDDPRPSASWKRASNVGFGFSYALPVVVAGLTARPGRLLIIENPEAHLHPSGQSLIGQFLVRVAAAGIQVVLETHSDHVINGIRLACAHQALLPAEQVVFHYFSSGEPPQEIRLSASGSLSAWPPGFFDQFEQDIGRIARLTSDG